MSRNDHQRPGQRATRPAGRGTAEHAKPVRPSQRSAVQPAPRMASGLQQIPPEARATSPSARSATVDTKSGKVAASTPSKAPRGWRAGMGMQIKFTGVLCCITAVALMVLGVAMWGVSSRFLFGLRVQSGIEIAKAIAQVPVALRPQIVGRQLSADAVRALAKTQLENAVTWGSGARRERVFSDIDSIEILIPGGPDDLRQLSGTYVATEGSFVSVAGGDEIFDVFVPKVGETLMLPKGITVYAGTRKVESTGTTAPIYRFKVALPSDDFGVNAFVRIDLTAESVNRVTGNLLLTVLAIVLIAMGLTAGVAWWLAKHITRPLRVLVRDMQLVSQGDLDHRTKPHSTDEIGLLAIEFNHMTAGLKQAQALSLERERDQERARSELTIATEVQRHLLPSQVPNVPGYECSAHYQGAKGVSGDYFDFIDLGNGQLGFIVADVSGKGVPGAMVMAVTRTIIRLVAPEHGDRVDETLKSTNRLIANQIKRGMFVTAVFALLDVRRGVLTFASAGHNPLAVYRAASGTVEFVSGKGIALGFDKGPIFDKVIEVKRIALGHGDAVVLYTDGFPEAMNAANVEFGDDRFLAAIASNAGLGARQLINGLVGDVARHRGSAEQSDDLTIIAVRRL